MVKEKSFRSSMEKKIKNEKYVEDYMRKRML